METREEVRVVRVEKRCSKCGVGFMRPTGIVCSHNPPIRPHKCNNPECDFAERIEGKSYPYIEYEAVDQRIIMPDGEKINGMRVVNEKPGYPQRENAELP